MNYQLFFSIIIPTYNRAKFIAKAIESVIKQTYENWELIVIDDASTDNTKDLVSSFNDNRIRYERNSINLERSASRNKGIELSWGEYICFLDSDDHYKENCLEVFENKIQTSKKEVGLFYTGCIWRFPDKDVQVIHLPPNNVNWVEFVIEHPLPCICVCIHSSILKSIRFDTSMIMHEDVYLFAKIACNYPVFPINSFTAIAEVHGDNTINLFDDYVTVQKRSKEIILSDSSIKLRISISFIKRIKIDIHDKYIEMYKQQGNKRKHFEFLLIFLLKYPNHKTALNKFKWLISLIPGYRLLRNIFGYAQ